jgi:hypothetical protein
MPNYNPNDMAYVLRMAKTKAGSAMTPQELELMQGINTAMQPEVAAGNVRMIPQDIMRQQAGSAMTANEIQRMPPPVAMPQANARSPLGTPVPMPQLNPNRGGNIEGIGQVMPVPMPMIDGDQQMNQKVNRLAAIQAAANQVLAGGENPEGQRMANIAKYFQGRQ